MGSDLRKGPEQEATVLVDSALGLTPLPCLPWFTPTDETRATAGGVAGLVGPQFSPS